MLPRPRWSTCKGVAAAAAAAAAAGQSPSKYSRCRRGALKVNEQYLNGPSTLIRIFIHCSAELPLREMMHLLAPATHLSQASKKLEAGMAEHTYHSLLNLLPTILVTANMLLVIGHHTSRYQMCAVAGMIIFKQDLLSVTLKKSLVGDVQCVGSAHPFCTLTGLRRFKTCLLNNFGTAVQISQKGRDLCGGS